MHFLITAGPTREALDPVRFLSNRSSGRMGFAIAEAAAQAGHTVTLVAGPVALPAPPGVERVDVVSTQEMYEAVQARLPRAEAAVFSAAVADYRPVQVETQKIKKSADRLTLELERTPDILGSVRRVFGWRGVLVGFAAETEQVLEHARGKRTGKDCDLMVANDVSQPGTGFDAEENSVTLLFAGGGEETLPRMSKAAVAERVVAAVEKLAAGR